MARRRYEISTTGFDPSFQLTGSGPQGGGSYTGLIIPKTPTSSRGTRYLMALTGFAASGGQRGRIRGARQLVTIGARTFTEVGEDPPTFGNYYNVELMVTTPTWRFSDGNISWHLLRHPPQFRHFPNANNNQGNLFRYAQQDALVYETLAPYTAPWGGQLPAGGKGVGGLGQFYDLRFPWDAAQAWRSLSIPFEGPATYVLWASIWQTNPETRATITLPGGGTGTPTLGLPPEENFILALPPSVATGVQYWRIAGSLIVEEE